LTEDDKELLEVLGVQNEHETFVHVRQEDEESLLIPEYDTP